MNNPIPYTLTTKAHTALTQEKTMAIIKNTTRRTTPTCIDNMQEFDNTTKSVRGRKWTASNCPGDWGSQLPSNHEATMRAAHKESPIIYVVYSYQTIIGYVQANGRTTRPNVKYSLTTSRHQGMCNYTPRDAS